MIQQLIYLKQAKTGLRCFYRIRPLYIIMCRSRTTVSRFSGQKDRRFFRNRKLVSVTLLSFWTSSRMAADGSVEVSKRNSLFAPFSSTDEATNNFSEFPHKWGIHVDFFLYRTDILIYNWTIQSVQDARWKPSKKVFLLCTWRKEKKDWNMV